jgi:tryptophan-rich sensory protein
MTWTIIVAALAAIAVNAIGALVTEIGPWYRSLRKPSWQPPDWLFGPAWTLILGLAAWAGVVAWEHAPDAAGRTRVIALFAANATLHIFWSPLFFRWKRPDLALREVVFLWLSILALIIGLAPFSTTASWLLAPYLAWVTFAAWLNLTIVRLNGPFRGKVDSLQAGSAKGS